MVNTVVSRQSSLLAPPPAEALAWSRSGAARRTAWRRPVAEYRGRGLLQVKLGGQDRIEDYITLKEHMQVILD